jgi:hypothetical protein
VASFTATYVSSIGDSGISSSVLISWSATPQPILSVGRNGLFYFVLAIKPLLFLPVVVLVRLGNTFNDYWNTHSFGQHEYDGGKAISNNNNKHLDLNIRGLVTGIPGSRYGNHLVFWILDFGYRILANPESTRKMS